jgi:hypothetical protein
MVRFGLESGRLNVYNKHVSFSFILFNESFLKVTVDLGFREQCMKLDPESLYLLVISGEDSNI